ncbi:PQQ-binding-like beta-propeller repeat protein [Seonamhaeicola maritimus]|uniref:PQQ-binding-like beta-propeller repeat protein n=1 Tax=Seonamhaeicola maritimus TaxID=2591822 RepID=A0A5C7GFT4_9FLAO|nr:PQQ-binding-like beta-propeller repeat protein [Seonamhaeicola maritimus]TXG36111.1 PQQ-binding-like beta-propeller repeat protein [Seonamhaeicola maritimus]
MKKYYIIVLLVISISSCFAQKVKELGFENNGDNWQSDSSNYWKVTTEKASSGSGALKFEIPEDHQFQSSALYSIETGHTIHKIRTAKFNSEDYIIASSYDGIVMAVAFDGNILWKNKLSGFMVHDMWCEDIDGDEHEEILIANANGTIYCLDQQGKVVWEYSKNEVPMYSVCVVKKDGTPYVVSGSLDLNVYYLSASGELVRDLKSESYSQEKTWGTTTAKDFVHYANFLRKYQKDDDNDILVMHVSNNPSQDRGAIYLFDPLADNPIKRIETSSSGPIGELRISDFNNDGNKEILLGVSNHQNNAGVSRVNLIDDSTDQYDITKLGFGYSVVQPELILDGSNQKYMFFVGNHIVLLDTDLDPNSEVKLVSKYSYYDMWKLTGTSKIVLASCQSGGSQIHILNTEQSGWKEAYKDLIPKGKLQKIKDNTQSIRSNLAAYQAPVEQRDLLPIYFMTESTGSGLAKSVADNIRNNLDSPMFLGGSHMGQAEDWDRSGMANAKYRDRRDSRRNYNMTQQEAIDHITDWYDEVPDGEDGIAYWGGHGNDPYMFQLSTTQQILDYANGKKTVLIYPELEDHSSDFAWVMEDLFYPLATYSETRNSNIFVRTKHNFWQGNVYLPMWSRLLSGEFSNVIVPSMEETTDKAMDISIASRAGIWASGAVDSWGTRTVPDNPSYDRSRQFCHQRLPNHFLRHLIYHMANGATYLNNFAIDPDYMSIVWELTAKGALYVPKPDEIVSYSPVHLSMFEPDDDFLVEGSSLKWATHYDEDFIENNAFVFSRQNANWMGAQNTTWDFSTYAGGVKDRRQNYLPNYPNGLVLITPPQMGAKADLSAPRGLLKDKLHPLYKDILKEYYTDGRYYYNADGTQQYDASTYASTIEDEIKEAAKQIPLTVTGDVAWVVAQTSPTNLRLTILDGGYLNPEDREATVSFQTITPVSMTDIIDGKAFNLSDKANVKVDIPCGAFRFIDIKLNGPLN